MARKRKKRSPAMSILAFVTALVIVTTFIYLRGKKHKVQAVSQYTNTSIYSYQNVNFRDSRRTLLKHSFRKKRLVDAMWTMKPKIPERWKYPENKQSFGANMQNKNSGEIVEDETIEVDLTQTTPSDTDSELTPSSYSSQTTPSVTDAPTTPITTQSETTPIYTESPTSPITTESITTPIVTEPGEREITTELDPDSDPNDTLWLLRNRRGVGATPTSPDPLTTSVQPPECGEGMDNDDYYIGPNGDCECGYNMTGPSCSTEDTEENINQKKMSSLQYETLADGEFTNDQRADFQAELEKHYSDLEGFQRIFVMPMVYDPETNKTSLSYIIFFDTPTDAEDAAKSASKTYDIVGHVLPIMIDNQPVTFGEEDTYLIRPTINDSVDRIPLGSQTKENVCYIYEQLQACDHGENRGKCVNRNGIPMCECTTQYVGEFCQEVVQYAPASTEEEILPVLLPALAAVAAAVALCSCCFFCCRRVNKGDDEASSYTETLIESPPLILPRYHPFAFKQFIAGAEAEEYNAVYVDRPVIQPVIVERTIVKERPVRQVVQEAVVPVVREVVVPVVQNAVVPVVQDVHDREDVGRPYVREDLRPYVLENGGAIWNTSSNSDRSTEITSPSLILPRFHPTPFRQFIPGSEGDEEEIRSMKFA
ncbi:uncharacterized protein LOC123560342 [Mercenaria mercenaria]|uniref:uncharacterized protein LOC123560342 n=1 Tax=Mercenaria mercenaria TaxID=6596 RepID=UPI00234F2FE0|nr:uncharacterized protein LOC123560342 [Mercenaria mercenaria]